MWLTLQLAILTDLINIIFESRTYDECRSLEDGLKYKYCTTWDYVLKVFAVFYQTVGSVKQCHSFLTKVRLFLLLLFCCEKDRFSLNYVVISISLCLTCVVIGNDLCPEGVSRV